MVNFMTERLERNGNDFGMEMVWNGISSDVEKVKLNIKLDGVSLNS